MVAGPELKAWGRHLVLTNPKYEARLHWEFEITTDHRDGNLFGNLKDKLNTCGAVSPRFDVQFKDLPKWQKNLPFPPVWFL